MQQYLHAFLELFCLSTPLCAQDIKSKLPLALSAHSAAASHRRLLERSLEFLNWGAFADDPALVAVAQGVANINALIWAIERAKKWERAAREYK